MDLSGRYHPVQLRVASLGWIQMGNLALWCMGLRNGRRLSLRMKRELIDNQSVNRILVILASFSARSLKNTTNSSFSWSIEKVTAYSTSRSSSSPEWMISVLWITDYFFADTEWYCYRGVYTILILSHSSIFFTVHSVSSSGWLGFSSTVSSLIIITSSIFLLVNTRVFPSLCTK